MNTDNDALSAAVRIALHYSEIANETLQIRRYEASLQREEKKIMRYVRWARRRNKTIQIRRAYLEHDIAAELDLELLEDDL